MNNRLTHLPEPPEERAEKRPSFRLGACADETRLLAAYASTLEVALMQETNHGGGLLGLDHSRLASHLTLELEHLARELNAVSAALRSGAVPPEAPTAAAAAAGQHTGVAGRGTEDAGSAPAEGRN